MIREASLVVLVFAVAAVGSFNPLPDHAIGHTKEAVRNLTVNEEVKYTGSDLEFSWAKCAICDGYNISLQLESCSGVQETPFLIKAAVTSLKITDVSPRTVFRLVVRRLASDLPKSQMSGRTFCQEIPPPVDNLEARPLTSSSIKIEWQSKLADGFIASVLENDTPVIEGLISEFRDHPTVNMTGLEPETHYTVQVIAFFSSAAGESNSTVSRVTVKTLPVNLPTPQLTYELTPRLKLSWTNSVRLTPVAHKISCSRKSLKFFEVVLSASTDSVSLTELAETGGIGCVLETWYSESDEAKVSSEVVIPESAEESPPSYLTDTFDCYGQRQLRINLTAWLKVERAGDVELVLLRFKMSDSPYLTPEKFSYRLCGQDPPCDPWITASQRKNPTILLKPGDLRAWTNYTVEWGTYIRCKVVHGSASRKYSSGHRIRVPALIGPVDPVAELSAKASVLSWKYGSSSAPPDYFLVTCCVKDVCTSQRVLGKDRHVSLGNMESYHQHYVTIQAVKIKDGKAHLSVLKTLTIVGPMPRSTLISTEKKNSSTVLMDSVDFRMRDGDVVSSITEIIW